jgi:hypothetical protein
MYEIANHLVGTCVQSSERTGGSEQGNQPLQVPGFNLELKSDELLKKESKPTNWACKRWRTGRRGWLGQMAIFVQDDIPRGSHLVIPPPFRCLRHVTNSLFHDRYNNKNKSMTPATLRGRGGFGVPILFSCSLASFCMPAFAPSTSRLANLSSQPMPRRTVC